MGSTFRIQLPLAPDQPDEVREAPPERTPERSPGMYRRRILVVDDNRDAAEVLAEALDTWGHETRVAFDAPGALELADTFDFEIALLDIGLPVMDGYELAKRLRHASGSLDARLVAITAYGQENDRARSRDAGFALHLVKPIDLSALQQYIDSVPRPASHPSA
jgi:CheY-like chemotaxis protein